MGRLGFVIYVEVVVNLVRDGVGLA